MGHYLRPLVLSGGRRARLHQGGPKRPGQLDPLLQERNFGDLRGTPYSELEQNPFAPDYEPPGGESWEVFHARVDAAWRRVAATAAETAGGLAVVTHGLVCTSLASRILSLGPDQITPDRFENTALTVVDSEPPWQVRILNCTAHLTGELRRTVRGIVPGDA